MLIHIHHQFALGSTPEYNTKLRLCEYEQVYKNIVVGSMHINVLHYMIIINEVLQIFKFI